MMKITDVRSKIKSNIIFGYQDFRHMFDKMLDKAEKGLQEGLDDLGLTENDAYTPEQAKYLIDKAMGFALDVT